jgi:hypothetical protein
MPLRSGFRSRVDCPLWLLDFQDITIIPLANPEAKRKQTNPIYSRRPGQGGGMLAELCSIEVIAKRFSMGQIGNMLFVAAEIDMPEFALQGWINIWQGTHITGPGTLFCALRHNDYTCLCGSCMHSWVRQGWVCELIWRHRFELGIGYSQQMEGLCIDERIQF